MKHPWTLFQRSTWGVFQIKTTTIPTDVAKEEKPQSPVPVNTTFDVKRILALGIPDIAAVYGGVRGRTMSSARQNYAWPTIREAGVRTIIDLREDGVYTRLSDLCRQNGIEYFYYPVDNKREYIAEMVKQLPQLCKYIDAGSFYIACAMGLHRTDIALCAYWMFHAADKGIAPPPIRGYRKEDGHNTNKIMRVLNAMYDYMTERDGVEPMPMREFRARKKEINEQSMVNEDSSQVELDTDTADAFRNIKMLKAKEDRRKEIVKWHIQAQIEMRKKNW